MALCYLSTNPSGEKESKNLQRGGKEKCKHVEEIGPVC